MTPPASDEHVMRVECESRITKLETKISVICQKCEAIFNVLDAMRNAEAKQRTDVAVLKTQAAFYGGIISIIVTPITAIAIHLLTK